MSRELSDELRKRADWLTTVHFDNQYDENMKVFLESNLVDIARDLDAKDARIAALETERDDYRKAASAEASKVDELQKRNCELLDFALQLCDLIIKSDPSKAGELKGSMNSLREEKRGLQP